VVVFIFLVITFQDERENPTPVHSPTKLQIFLDHWQYVSFRELLLFIIDLPFFLLTIFIAFAPWRAWALKKILREVKLLQGREIS
jgi:hypothetical protein